MADPAAAIKIADDYHLKYAFKNNPTIKIPVYIDDNTVDVRVHDLPLDLPNAKIIDAMREYGEVLTIRDEVWRNFFAGVPNGVRVVKMKLSKPVPSFITVCELSSLATYTGQTATCRRCGENRHVSKSCAEAAKKNRLNKPQHQSSKTNPPVPLPQEEASAEKRSCVDEENNTPISGNEQCNDPGQRETQPKIITPKRRQWKPAV